ncbi:peptidase S8/S53 domain-containing protein [Lactarius indigo]|nr:peptidase S8/S53 domain-containing protein [Lactarius indigo]
MPNYRRYDPNIPTVEVNLDVECLAYQTPLVFYSTGDGESGTDDLVSLLAYVIDETIVRQDNQHIIRFLLSGTLPLEYAEGDVRADRTARCRSVSVLFPASDSDVGKGYCPWVTTVGGTTDYPEVAADFSGGGFSGYFEQPLYQKEAAPAFFKSLGNLYQGRGTPDIATQATGLRFFVKGDEMEGPGTSGAMPVYVSLSESSIAATVISLLNDYRISKGKGSPGFLNIGYAATGSRASTTSYLALIRAATFLDSLASLVGIVPQESRLVSSFDVS